MVDIILMEPEEEGNIGAVARAMANFGQKKLVIVKPKADHLSGVSVARSKHAKGILERSRVLKELKGYDTLIATTSKLGSDYNLPRSPVTPSEVAPIISRADGKVGILFGREGIGLTNEEIAQCDFVMTIPTDSKYPALNLSHAVALVCYELSKASEEAKIKAKFKPIGEKDKQVILEKFEEIFSKLEFSTSQKKETQRRFWKKLLGKSFLTKREAYIIMGLLKKISGKV